MFKKKGFTLTEIMVALAIAGGIGIAITRILNDYQMKTKTAKAKDELETTHQGILSILSDLQSCNLTFQDKSFGDEITINDDDQTKQGITKSKNGIADPSYIVNPKGSKIKLKSIKLGPVSSTSPAPEKGRLTTVSFYYDVYKNEKGGPALILGETKMVRHHQFIFYNYIEKGLISETEPCDGITINAKEYTMEIENPPYKKFLKQSTCLDTNLSNPITKCVF